MVRPDPFRPQGHRAVRRSRWHTQLGATKRAVGLPVLLLAISGIWPLPLIKVLPAVTVALLAVALLQEDGLMPASFAIAILIPGSSRSPFRTSAGAIDLFRNRLHLPWQLDPAHRTAPIHIPSKTGLLSQEPMSSSLVALRPHDWICADPDKKQGHV